MRVLFFVFCFLNLINSYAKNHENELFDTSNCIVVNSDDLSNNNPSPILKLIKKRQRLNKKITAAALAFPFPFGIVGLHRIYLGTKPHVPIVYIATLGGVFGILPLVDFFVIVVDKDFDQYKNNGQIFMWIKD